MLVGCSSAPTPSPPPKYDGPRKTVLVELFTSQGCNSCPAADAFVAGFPEIGWTPDKVVPLTFHVTYWDDLGWKDPYASPLFDQRQIGYARELPQARAASESTLRGPYTPQMVVDGRVHFSGSMRDVAREEVDRAANRPTLIDLDAEVLVQSGDDGDAVQVDVRSVKGSDAVFDTDRSKIGLFAALTQRRVQTKVPRGENAGKTLSEHAVVRTFAGPKLFRSAKPVNETRFVLAVPANTRSDQLDAVVFAQDLATLDVIAARRIAIE